MRTEEYNLLHRLLHKDDIDTFMNVKHKKYVLSKPKHKNVYVFYKNNRVIVLDKRCKTTNVYNDLKVAAKKMDI